MSRVGHLCRQSRFHNQKSGTNAQIQHRSAIREDRNSHYWAFPGERQGKRIPPDHHGLIHEVTSLRHPQSRGMATGRRPGDQLPLLLHPDGAVQRPGPARRFQTNAGVMKHLRFTKTRTLPLHPQSDEMLERYVKTIAERLVKMVHTHQRD